MFDSNYFLYVFSSARKGLKCCEFITFAKLLKVKVLFLIHLHRMQEKAL